MKIINGRKIKKEILENVKSEIEKLSFTPFFCDVLVGDDLASLQYVNLKKKTALSLGINFHEANFSENITTEELIQEIEKINKVPNMCGIIIQLPLPSHLDKEKVLSAIDPLLDVDCLGKVNSNKFYSNQYEIAYPTAEACVYLFDEIINNLETKDKQIVILGEGRLVGKPTAHLLESRGLQVDTVNSKTENKEELIKNAEIIISAIGKPKYINKNMIKDKVNIIDAGTAEEDGGVVGDVDFESVKEKCNFITPSPGGVGPVTVAMLFQNILQVAKKLNK
jgi:methylenetetrahydrofolate dehydrogenase (NADP+)/methenyltetrahydrofolate cyclohydrolase